MGKKRSRQEDDPVGPILAANLARLGYADVVIRTTEIARLVTEKTGHGMTRQRVAQVLNAVRVDPKTIEWIAKGLGVKPEELTRPIKKGKGK